MLATQQLVGRLIGSAPMAGAVRAVSRPRLARWIFERYLEITPPPPRRIASHAPATGSTMPMMRAASSG
jgi:hypothetical protein